VADVFHHQSGLGGNIAGMQDAAVFQGKRARARHVHEIAVFDGLRIGAGGQRSPVGADDFLLHGHGQATPPFG